VVALYGLNLLLVVYGNVTDYGANREFVQHVLAMDTTNFGQPAGVGLNPKIMGRAITNPVLHDVAYVGIILWEAASALVLLTAAFAFLRGFRHGEFSRARRMGSIGLLMVFLLFFGGFMTIGGEWFQMWRSNAWNGLDPAFRHAALSAIGLVLIHLPSKDWTDAREPLP
jgi:predicted small integral membrane protein